MTVKPEPGAHYGSNTRGVSGVTLNQFFAAVLNGLGAPITANNLSKMGTTLSPTLLTARIFELTLQLLRYC